MDINNLPAMTGRMLREDGSTVNIAELLAYIAGGAGIVKPDNYIYVGKNGNDTTGDGSANLPFLTVQKAIDVAGSGDTVFIWPGTYTENITFKAGVYVTSPVRYGVYLIGNHVANFTGTVVLDGIVLQSSTGDTLTFSGSGAQNFQLSGSSINAGTGNAINWTNTNAASQILFEDGTSNVSTSGASARCFTSSAGAKGTMLANRVSFKVNNPNNVCLNIAGDIDFYHTSDQVVGQVVVSNLSTYIATLLNITTGNVAAMVTNSSGTSVLSSVLATTTASPAFTGAGGFAFVAIEYGSTGVGGANTLNGGVGAIPLLMAPIRLRASTLTVGKNDGTFEYDGTDLYFTIGTTRKKFAFVVE